MKALVSEFNKTFPDCWDWNRSASNTTYSLTKVNYRTKVNELLAKIIACNMVASAWVHSLGQDEHSEQNSKQEQRLDENKLNCILSKSILLSTHRTHITDCNIELTIT